MDSEELMEILLDLKHDLGKYLYLPLAMLPKGAAESEVRQALHQALFHTRKSGSSVRSARTVWQDFLEEVEGVFSDKQVYLELELAVQRALRWEDALSQEAETEVGIDRAVVEQDLRGVSEAIMELIDKVGEK